MNTQRELLPCPFCGGKDLEVRPDVSDVSEGVPTYTYAFHVFCKDCHASGRNNYPISWCETPMMAIEAWNNRFIPATIPGENGRLLISANAMLHIRGELNRIDQIHKHIGDLLTPIQLTKKEDGE